MLIIADRHSIVQSAVELAILEGIAMKLKQTTEIGNSTWNKITAIGHSYGSALTLGLATTSADLIDGVILTGFSNDLTGFGPFCECMRRHFVVVQGCSLLLCDLSARLRPDHRLRGWSIGV